MRLVATAKLDAGREIKEDKSYEYASWARAYRDRFLARVSKLGAVGDVTIWFDEQGGDERVPELDDEYRAIVG